MCDICTNSPVGRNNPVASCRLRDSLSLTASRFWPMFLFQYWPVAEGASEVKVRCVGKFDFGFVYGEISMDVYGVMTTLPTSPCFVCRELKVGSQEAVQNLMSATPLEWAPNLDYRGRHYNLYHIGPLTKYPEISRFACVTSSAGRACPLIFTRNCGPRVRNKKLHRWMCRPM